MKKTKIKPLPVIKTFTAYIVGRGKRALGLKNAEFDHVSIDVDPKRGTIWVWFHAPERVVGRVQLYFNGRCYHKLDWRPEDTQE